jgi:ATP-dependent DNA helicase DinG
MGRRDVTDHLAAAVAALPGGGEGRTGQRDMAVAVDGALTRRRHLFVQAGTGTGKSIGYLLPAILSGRRTVVATATKALQDQLAGKDLPFLAEVLDTPFSHAVLKGRSNYVCRQRLAELGGAQLALDDAGAERARADQLARIVAWAADTDSGDRAELDFEPTPATWSAVSVGVRECPGASRCPRGESCFAEKARSTAAAADVIVVNQHLLALDLALDGVLLPEHDVVIVDEAHMLEDVVSNAAGTEISSGRVVALARAVRAVVADEALLADVEKAAEVLDAVLLALKGRRIVTPIPDELSDAANLARDRVERAAHALRNVPDDKGDDVAARKLRAVQASTALLGDLDALLFLDTDRDVAWVEGTERTTVLNIAPIDVGAVLEEHLWPKRTTVLTSATLPPRLAERLGVGASEHDELDVGTPFDFATQGLLYCATHMPDPRDARYAEALRAELETLIVAAGGRTMALFTSWRAMRDAVEFLRPRLPWPVLAQGDLPKPALVERFVEDESASLFATMSFWQGVDVPGPSLSLVTIDRIPFPRPDDPLLSARRERVGAEAFRVIDVPRAATLLAQGAGRLIRRADDRGVVAVLDPRLAKSRSYRWDIINALPPLRRTRERAEAVAFLQAIRDERAAAGVG